MFILTLIAFPDYSYYNISIEPARDYIDSFKTEDDLPASGGVDYMSSIEVTHKQIYSHVLGNHCDVLRGLRTVQKSQKRHWHLCPEVGYRETYDKDHAERACIPSTQRKAVENSKCSPKSSNLHHYLPDIALATRPETKEDEWILELMTT